MGCAGLAAVLTPPAVAAAATFYIDIVVTLSYPILSYLILSYLILSGDRKQNL